MCERPPEDEVKDLSDDQRLLLEYVFGIDSGHIDDKFVKRKPGPLSHSRWLTTATRILILYTRTVEPSDTLKILVTFIVRSYAPTWFLVRRNNNFTSGPFILFKIIEGVKEVEEMVKIYFKHSGQGEVELEGEDDSITSVVFKVLARNAFCCLGENFLASMLYSSQEDLRQVCYETNLPWFLYFKFRYFITSTF